MTVAFECAAHEGFYPLAFDVQNDRKWNVDIAEEVDIVCVCNVVDDECPSNELFMVAVVALGMLAVAVVFLAVVALVALVGIRIALFSAVSVGIVLGMLSMCVVLISVAVVLSQKCCSGKEEQGGEQGLE
jgi:hypothetical protein